MNELDIAFAVIAFISMVIGVLRGAVKELFYLAGWIIAFIAAPVLGPTLSQFVLPELIQDEPMRQVVAIGFAFLLTLIVCMLLATIISSIVKSVGLGSLDRFLGGAYGLARSGVLLVLFTLLAGLTTLPKHDIWRGSAVIPFAKMAVLAMQPYLPFAFAKRLNYRF